MQRCRAMVLGIAIFTSTLVSAPQLGAQNEGVPAHGGAAEAFINNCAAVNRLDAQNRIATEDAQGLTYCYG